MEWLITLLTFAVLGWRAWRWTQHRKAVREAAQAREAAFMAELMAFQASRNVNGEGAGMAGKPAVPAERAVALAVPPQPASVPPASVVEQARPRSAPAPVTDTLHGAAAQQPVDAVPPAVPGRAYLSRRAALVYRLLQLAAGEGEVFPRSSLRAVLGREAVSRDLPLDFVVCNADLHTVAVVDLIRDSDSEPVVEIKHECLAGAGLRYLRVDPAQPPQPATLAKALGFVVQKPASGRA